MKIQEHTEVIMAKLDKIDAKLDQHLERISKVEERVESHAGFIKSSVAILTTVVVALIGGLIKLFVGK